MAQSLLLVFAAVLALSSATTLYVTEEGSGHTCAIISFDSIKLNTRIKNQPTDVLFDSKSNYSVTQVVSCFEQGFFQKHITFNASNNGKEATTFELDFKGSWSEPTTPKSTSASSTTAPATTTTVAPTPASTTKTSAPTTTRPATTNPLTTKSSTTTTAKPTTTSAKRPSTTTSSTAKRITTPAATTTSRAAPATPKTADSSTSSPTTSTTSDTPTSATSTNTTQSTPSPSPTTPRGKQVSRPRRDASPHELAQSWYLRVVRVAVVDGGKGNIQYDDTNSSIQSKHGYGYVCPSDTSFDLSAVNITFNNITVQPFNVYDNQSKVLPAPNATLESCPTISTSRDHTLAIVVAGITGGVIAIALCVYVYMGMRKSGYQAIN